MSSDATERQVTLLRKNWEIVQGIIKGLGERGWKIRSWALTIWWAVVAYAVTSNHPQLILYLLAFVLIIFLIDVPGRLTENGFRY